MLTKRSNIWHFKSFEILYQQIHIEGLWSIKILLASNIAVDTGDLHGISSDED